MPGDGIRAAMILHNGAPVELIEFKKKKVRETGIKMKNIRLENELAECIEK
jgi:hypothetical protein